MPTIGSDLEKSKGIGGGFDFVRISLAVSILAFHSVVVTGGMNDLNGTPLWIVSSMLVPMFFAVSGFLITGSGIRLSLSNFLANRGVRIFPALFADIIFSALIIGPLFTQMPLKEYFSDPDFYEYFGSVVGLIQYDLPGVFLKNESIGVVNQSLWTIPWELFCYFVITVLILGGLLKRPKIILMTSIFFLAVPVFINFAVSEISDLPKIVFSLFFGRGAGSFQSFLCGICVYLYRYSILKSNIIFVICIFWVILISLFGDFSWVRSGYLNFILVPPLTYAILFIGLLKIKPLPIYSMGDYSYGIYLYGYPFQQAIYSLGSFQQSALVNFSIALPIVTMVAMFSWHIVEKPILKHRKNVSNRQLSKST